MTLPESHRDLYDAPGVATLTTVTPDGLLQSTAVWYLLDDDGLLKVSLSDARKKLRNLRANPAATLFFIDPTNPFRTLEVRARATIEPDADFSVRAKVGARYGADVAAFDQPGDLRFVVTLHPVRVNAS